DEGPPASTYRVQLTADFTLSDLANQVPYLAELGITDIYLSPIYVARPGSSHGYDIVDYGNIDPQLGGCEGWRRLCKALHSCGVGVVLDVVPNHMAADPVHKRFWRRGVREGPSTPASRDLGVDWNPLTGLIHNKVILPLLEEPYGEALAQHRVVLERSDDQLLVRYGSIDLPVAPPSLDRLPATSRHGRNGGPNEELDRAIEDTNIDP